MAESLLREKESSESQDSEYISSDYNSKSSSDDSSATAEERKDSDQEAGEDGHSSDDDRRSNTEIADEGSKRHDEEERLANKREDFEKMQELAAHMDNVVRRLSRLFPLDKVGDHTTAPPRGSVPGFPPIPSPNKPEQTRSVSASPRTTMDRAVSARKLTVDRAVSVASDLPLDDGLPVSVGDHPADSAGQVQNPTRGQEINKAPRDSRRDWGRADGEVERCKGLTNHSGQETAVRDARRRSTPWSGERKDDGVETSAIEMMQQPRYRYRYPKGRYPNPTEGKRAHHDHVVTSSSRNNIVEGLGEQKLWNEPRESLMGREGHVPGSWFAGKLLLANSEERRDDDKAAEKQRRKLIDEAIAILLEPSSCDEDELECNGGV